METEGKVMAAWCWRKSAVGGCCGTGIKFCLCKISNFQRFSVQPYAYGYQYSTAHGQFR